WYDAGNDRCVDTERRLNFVRGCLARIFHDRFGERRTGSLPIAIEARAAQDFHTTMTREIDKLVEGPRLADPSLTSKQRNGTVALASRLELLGKTAQMFVAPDERSASDERRRIVALVDDFRDVCRRRDTFEIEVAQVVEVERLAPGQELNDE